jgi:hypothetical protein
VRRARIAKPRLIAVDGIEAPAVLATAKAVLAASTPGAPEARGGISRWDAYDAHALTVAAIAIGLAAAVALVGAATRRRAGLAIIGFLVSSAAFALYFVAFLANSLN